MTKQCRTCNTALPDEADFCIKCGQPISKAQTQPAVKDKKSGLWILSIFTAILIFIGAWLTFQDVEDKYSQSQRVIDIAEKETARLEQESERLAEIRKIQTSKRDPNTVNTPAMIEARKQYAKDLDRSFLERYIEVEITARGAKADVLQIKSILVSRVFIQNYYTLDVQLAVKKYGFRRIVFTNGFGTEYAMNID